MNNPLIYYCQYSNKCFKFYQSTLPYSYCVRTITPSTDNTISFDAYSDASDYYDKLIKTDQFNQDFLGYIRDE